MFKKPAIRRIIELLNSGLSERDVARALHASRNTISAIKNGLDASDQTAEQLLALSSNELYEMFFPDRFIAESLYEPVDCKYIHAELRKVGVTLKLLWEEYSHNCIRNEKTPCSYATFTRIYGKYTARREYSSHVSHKPGVTVEVDWSGPTMTYFDPDIGEAHKAYLFVATFPYSQFSYVEATESMNESSWLGCHVNMFDYFGGVPLKIVCDNLKTGVVSHPRNGDIVLNEEYLMLAEHYNVAVMPAGVKKPKHLPIRSIKPVLRVRLEKLQQQLLQNSGMKGFILWKVSMVPSEKSWQNLMPPRFRKETEAGSLFSTRRKNLT